MTENQDLRTALEQLLQPVKDTAAYTARLVKHVGERLDAMSLDIARGTGAIVRNAKGLADAAKDQATTVSRATPRVEARHHRPPATSPGAVPEEPSACPRSS